MILFTQINTGSVKSNINEPDAFSNRARFHFERLTYYITSVAGNLRKKNHKLIKKIEFYYRKNYVTDPNRKRKLYSSA